MRFAPKVSVLSFFGLVLVASALQAEAMAGRIAAGERQSCAISLTGAVTCWGQRTTGSLGDGGTKGSSYRPIPVVGLKAGATDIAGTTTGNGGSMFGCAVVSGSAKCWGTGSAGTLGDGKKQSSAVPVQVTGLTSGVTNVSLNATHACAVQSGAVKCWGTSYLGGAAKSSPVPVQAVGLTSGATAVALGWRTSCALVSGAVSCWGLSDAPTAVAGLAGTVTGIAAGQDFACALAGGGVWCWGRSIAGGKSATPTQIKGLESGVTAIAANWVHACAIKGGVVWCWGEDTYGQLGDGAKLSPGHGGPPARETPVPVAGPTGVTDIATGRAHTCAIAAGEEIWCWGSNSGGQLGNEAVGGQTSVAVRATGPLLPRIAVAKGRLDAAGNATVATVTCPTGGTCLVTVPKSLKVRVGGKLQTLKLTATSAIGAGKTGTISVAATPAVAAALKGKTASAKVTLDVSRNGEPNPLAFTARLKG